MRSSIDTASNEKLPFCNSVALWSRRAVTRLPVGNQWPLSLSLDAAPANSGDARAERNQEERHFRFHFSTSRTFRWRPIGTALANPPLASVIVGARNEEQLRQNLGAVGWNLTREQVAHLDAASELPSAYPYWQQVQFADRNPPPI